MVRTILCLWLVGIGAPGDDPAAEIAALGGRCVRNDAGETIGVDLHRDLHRVHDPALQSVKQGSCL